MSSLTASEREELRDAEIKVQQKACFQAIRDAILAGDECTADEVGSSLLESLVDTPDLLELVRTALSSSADVTGKRFTDLLIKSMQPRAEVDAIHQVEQMEADALAEHDPVPRTLQRIADEWRAAGA